MRFPLILVLLAGLALAAPAGAATPDPAADPDLRERQLIERLTIERANALATNDARWSAQYADRARRLDAAERALRAARATTAAATAELARLASEKKALADEIAAKDQAYAQEIAAYRQLMTGVVTEASPEKLIALERYAAGDRIGAFPVLQQITEAENAARDKAAAAIAAQADAARRRANAENMRALGAQALDMLSRGELTTDRALPIWEQVTELDPDDSWSWIEMARLAFTVGKLEVADGAYKQALAHADTDDEKVASLQGLAQTQIRLGDLAGARASLERSVAMATAAAAADNSVVAQSNVISTLLSLADVQMSQGEVIVAARTTVKALEIGIALHHANPQSADVARMVAQVAFVGGTKFQAMGKAAVAEQSFALSAQLYANILPAFVTRADKYAIASVRLQQGVLHYEAGDFTKSLGEFTQASHELEVLAAADPSDQNLRVALTDALNRLGDVQVELRNWPAARVAFARSLELSRAIAANSPGDLQLRRNVAVALDRLGGVQMEDGRLDDAKASFEQAMAIITPALAANPRAFEARWDTAHFYWRFGQVAEKRPDPALAAGHYLKCLAILTELNAEQPRVRGYQRDLAEVATDLAQAQFAAGEKGLAAANYQRGLALAVLVADDERTSAAAQRSLAVTLYRMARDLGGEGAWAKVVAQYAKVAALGPLTQEDQKQLNEAKREAAS